MEQRTTDRIVDAVIVVIVLALIVLVVYWLATS
jgi:hypothetical protein